MYIHGKNSPTVRSTEHETSYMCMYVHLDLHIHVAENDKLQLHVHAHLPHLMLSLSNDVLSETAVRRAKVRSFSLESCTLNDDK